MLILFIVLIFNISHILEQWAAVTLLSRQPPHHYSSVVVYNDTKLISIGNNYFDYFKMTHNSCMASATSQKPMSSLCYHGDAVVVAPDDARGPSRSVGVTAGGPIAQPNHT